MLVIAPLPRLQYDQYFPVSLILLLFRLPKGSQNKSIKYEKLGKILVILHPESCDDYA